MKRFFGCHVSAAGGLKNAIANGQELGVNSIQIHPSPPQRWNREATNASRVKEFLAVRGRSEIQKVFFHAIYLINLATPDLDKLELASNSLIHYLNLLSQIKGDGVIVHVGSMKDQDEEAGYEQIISAVDYILQNSAGDSTLLLEVAAGSGKVIGSNMEELAKIYEGVTDQQRLGFALDSQHLWASGYDLKDNLEDVIEKAGSLFGFENIKAVHLNDSKTELGSKRDRHENLGDGFIGYDALEAFVNHSALRDIPFILETPGLRSMETAKKEVARLRRMIRE